MRDVELYRRILGLEMPWTVTRVDLLVTEQRVEEELQARVIDRKTIWASIGRGALDQLTAVNRQDVSGC